MGRLLENALLAPRTAATETELGKRTPRPCVDEAPSSADELNLVGRELAVRTHEAQVFAPCLGDQHPVERVGVVPRQPCRGFRMRPGARPRPATRVHGDIKNIFWNVELTDGALDSDLPHTRRRNIELAFGDRSDLRICEPWIVQDGPEQYMCVEQEPHLRRGTLLEQLGDLVVALEHVVRKRKLSFQRADKRASDGTVSRDDPGYGAAVAGQLDRLTGFRTADQLGELGLGFGNGDLHWHFPFSDHHIGHIYG